MFRKIHLSVKKIVKPRDISVRGGGIFYRLQACLRPTVAIGDAVLELKGGLAAPPLLGQLLAFPWLYNCLVSKGTVVMSLALLSLLYYFPLRDCKIELLSIP